MKATIDLDDLERIVRDAVETEARRYEHGQAGPVAVASTVVCEVKELAKSRVTETTRNNPKHYREMSHPFPSTDDANAALSAFFSDVEAARNKHRISDVVVICEVSHDLDGEEVRGAASASYGDSARFVTMLAREYGAESARHEDRLAKVMSSARKMVSK